MIEYLLIAKISHWQLCQKQFQPALTRTASSWGWHAG
jgi:hypothetical protein